MDIKITCGLALLFPVFLFTTIFLGLFGSLYQAKIARRLRAYPDDYRRMLVGGKPYLYIESMLSAGVPQAIQESLNLYRYFKLKQHVGKFSDRQRMTFIASWYLVPGAFILTFISIFFVFLCFDGIGSGELQRAMTKGH